MHFDWRGKKIILNSDESNNYVSIDDTDCALEYLDPSDTEKSCSPNGFIFRLKHLQEEDEYSIIKICKVFSPCRDPWLKKKQERFDREIGALEKIKEQESNANVIEIFSSGLVTIDSKQFPYYTMEMGEQDLASFLKSTPMSIPGRYQICFDIIKSIEALHSLDIYHRDIKPQNFLIVNGQVKIADLGLIDFREADSSAIDGDRERIGPRGFMSPEATNKCMSNLERTYEIDHKSDVFQLAKVLGFVLQDEIFSGFIAKEDLLTADNTGKLHSIIESSMQYSKDRRFDIGQLQTEFISSFGDLYAFS